VSLGFDALLDPADPELDVEALLAGAGAATARYPVRPAAANALPHNTAFRAREAGWTLADATPLP
jgi:hypothetical protein